MAVKKAWTVDVGASDEYVFTPANVGEDVYVAAHDGTVLRLNAKSGQVAWRIKADLPLTAGVGANASAVAVAGQKGVVFVFNSQGKLRWKTQASSEVLSSPVLSDKLVLVHSIDNRIAAYDIETGERKWILER
ncbi:MAG: PQQ-binding-like beta-propeller repeat protein, partial [Undibacterium sp.]|nr:PQQ-binding-like beta-propeller repeat protein [Undibacterium sp.]